jgi:hypothetical protein
MSTSDFLLGFFTVAWVIAEIAGGILDARRRRRERSFLQWVGWVNASHNVHRKNYRPEMIVDSAIDHPLEK